MSIKGHRDQIGRVFWRETFGERPLERDLWRETFGETLPGSDTRLLDFFREI